MALIQLSYQLIDDPELFNLICDSFDSVEEVKDEPLYRRKTIRVQHEEITKDDKVICPEIISFDGVKPFIIDFDV